MYIITQNKKFDLTNSEVRLGIDIWSNLDDTGRYLATDYSKCKWLGPILAWNIQMSHVLLCSYKTERNEYNNLLS
jgi:hypothetical protein